MQETSGKKWYVPFLPCEITPDQMRSIDQSSIEDKQAGTLFPTHLFKSVHTVADTNRLSRWEVVRVLRERQNPEGIVQIRKKYQEKFMYIGCVHGGSSEFIERLNGIIDKKEDLPDTVFLLGDLPGALEKKTDRQKKLFYNHFMNRVSSAVKENPQITKEELLRYTGQNVPEENPTVRDGVVNLLRFALEDMGGQKIEVTQDEAQIKELMAQQMYPEEAQKLQDGSSKNLEEMLEDYVTWVREKKLSSGTWVGTLPKDIRENYLNEYREAAHILIQPFLKLKEQGVIVKWIQGNEDLKGSLESMTKGISDVFDTEKYFKENGIECENQAGGMETESAFHVWFPFFSLWHPEEIEQGRMKSLQMQVKAAREKGKTIILAAHTQLDWGRHYPGQKAEAANKITEENLQKLVDDLKPDELVYPHQHDEMPESPDFNAKYIRGKTVVSYLPLHGVGELSVSTFDKKTKDIVIFGGRRQPIMRIF